MYVPTNLIVSDYITRTIHLTIRTIYRKFIWPFFIRLCEVMHLNPIPVIMAIILHSNIGGIITPIGDPVSIVITSHQYIAKHV